ncbi:MAG TPA: hypothetical protein VGN81_21005 [Pseudonocardiaceae bacterium]|jgi:hypothetical protein
MQGSEQALDVLRDIWHARSQSSAELDEIHGQRHQKTCKNMKNVGFGGNADPVDNDLRAAWRDRLEREGKLRPDGESVGDLLRDPADRG